jgi:outer membrane protein OmpA-like peptidoglycan-associated protein
LRPAAARRFFCCGKKFLPIGKKAAGTTFLVRSIYMERFMLRTMMLAAAALAALSASAQAGEAGVKVGILTCEVDSGWGYVLGSSRDIECVYRPLRGPEDRYQGSISKLGVDIGYTDTGTIIWDVIAPASDMGAGALEGMYGGATANATVIAGVGANVLLGGFERSIALQPVSVMGSSGLNIAAGLGALRLRHAERPHVAVAQMENRVLEPLPPPKEEAFSVYFPFDAADLDGENRAVIAEAADAIRSGPQSDVEVLVIGNTDTVGSYRYNDALSKARAAAVRDELVRNGIPAPMIAAVGHSFDDLNIPTGPETPEARNRRALILVRPVEAQRSARLE